MKRSYNNIDANADEMEGGGVIKTVWGEQNNSSDMEYDEDGNEIIRLGHTSHKKNIGLKLDSDDEENLLHCQQEDAFLSKPEFTNNFHESSWLWYLDWDKEKILDFADNFKPIEDDKDLRVAEAYKKGGVICCNK